MNIRLLCALSAMMATGVFCHASYSQSSRLTLDVSVTSDGKTVPGLTAKDFVITDNGKQATNLRVERPHPTNVVLVLDTQNAQTNDIPKMVHDLKIFLGRNGGKMTHRVGVVIIGTKGIQNSGSLTLDGNKLIHYLDTTDTTQVARIRDDSSQNGLQRVNDSVNALEQVVEMIGPLPGRKMVIWMGRGWPLMTALNMTSKAEDGIFAQLVEKSSNLRKAEVILYSANPISVLDGTFQATLWRGYVKAPSSGRSIEISNLELEGFAAQSGGQVFNTVTNLADDLDACIADANTFYTVSFDATPASKPNEYHPLTAGITRPGLVTRTRMGYYAQP